MALDREPRQRIQLFGSDAGRNSGFAGVLRESLRVEQNRSGQGGAEPGQSVLSSRQNRLDLCRASVQPEFRCPGA